MATHSPNIDWRNIRPLNGSQAGGFEEMCTQLGRQEISAGTRFERKGTPDAGVECYAIHSDGAEWGWQAKYFDALGESQWVQIDKSVKTALEKHPRLVKYFVCAPLDHSDARVSGHKSSKQRWDDRVLKWKKWANARGMAVEFLWWGNSELILKLLRTENLGLVRFWFDATVFDNKWFEARLDEAIRTAGPRYTPQIHIGLPIAEELEMFGRTDSFFTQIKTHGLRIRKALENFEYARVAVPAPILDAARSALQSQVQKILLQFSSINPDPTTALPLSEIVNQIGAAEGSAEGIQKLLWEHEREQAKSSAESKTGVDPEVSVRDVRSRLHFLTSELGEARDLLARGSEVAGRVIMILSGAAGTGKTHLLCDVATKRLQAGLPTVLLMGQRFVSADPPWSQALQQLDLARLSAEEFVGSLEAAAQSADCRALVLIDAINEGAGRLIWPTHLAAFLAQLTRSVWISVLVSIRSPFEEVLISEEVRKRAVSVVHTGFADHGYDAMRTFFAFYDIELPSTPLIAPEFYNPLFLKTLCSGLQAMGEHRLPRGFQGISAVFDLYLGTKNSRLAAALDFNPKSKLVQKALTAFAKAFTDPGKRWLTQADAETVVNALLPQREFSRSLFHGLIDEGLLVEDLIPSESSNYQNVVYIAYDRLADHIFVKMLLDSHLKEKTPASAFAPGAPLAFLWNKAQYISPSLLEAMCIQVPERTGKELVSLAPQLLSDWRIGDSFRQSVVWRATAAISDSTRTVLNKLVRTEQDWNDTLDVLLTVATLPDHPLNAIALHKTLSRYSMPDRDALWSIYLHHAFGSRNAVDRLIDWAAAVTAKNSLEEETIDLASTTLAWMLISSNRYLRDRATKALVNLMTGRLSSVVRFVERFADVNDLYVRERIYAVAYGVAMRSNDAAEIGTLAECVYARVFAQEQVVPHILLRDYARGVIERALSLKPKLKILTERIRPPYHTKWPKIPSAEALKPFLPDWSETSSYEGGNDCWARNRIGSSVMDDDFGRYVIGTNSWSTNWLSLRIHAKQWKPPNQQLVELVGTFSKEEKAAWNEFEEADAAVRRLSFPKLFQGFIRNVNAPERNENDDAEPEKEDDEDVELTVAQHERDQCQQALDAVLTRPHTRSLKSLLAKKDQNHGRPPQFDLRQIQRYVLKRVFDLGWTTERFGRFDRYTIGYHGREARKAERIGKKYQWLAYHEILALVGDHFQYHERFQDECGSHKYEGPWQDFLRDIDPSNTLRSTPGGTSFDEHPLAWWSPVQYRSWGDADDAQGWVEEYDDLPRPDDLLMPRRSADSSKWVNVEGHFNWKQSTPADMESSEIDRRELWYIFSAYLIRSSEASEFMRWAETVDFWGRWMPDAPDSHRMFLGEYGWSPAFEHFQRPYCEDDGWVRPEQGCPVQVRSIAFQYLQEGSGFDCSVDKGFSIHLPVVDLIKSMQLHWTGNGGDFSDSAGALVAFDPTVHEKGPSALLIREDSLREALQRLGFTICWTALGEKRILEAGFGSHSQPSLRLSGAYILDETGATGFLKCMVEDEKSDETNLKQIAIIRTEK
jgi:predicted ATPase